MKKRIFSLFLTLVLCVGLFASLGVTAFAEEEETPITEVDLSSLNVGENWGRKEAYDVGDAILTFGTDTMECYAAGFRDDNNNYFGVFDGVCFESGRNYTITMWISAKEGYYFPGTESSDDRNYDGTTVPADVVQAIAFDYCDDQSGDPIPAQRGHYLYINFEFTATETPIDVVDLSGLNAGKGWAGKTVSEVRDAFWAFETDTMESDGCFLFIKEDIYGYIQMKSGNIFESGKTYMIALGLSAKEGFYFPGTESVDGNNYAGTTIPADVFQTIVSGSRSEPEYTQHGYYLDIGFEFTATAEEGESGEPSSPISEPGDRHTHSFGDYTLIVPATCTTPGGEFAVCTGCGVEVTRLIPATGHSFGDYKETIAATCGAPGVETAKCDNCDATVTRPIPATGDHTFSDTWEHDETHHWHASTCGCDVKADYAEHTRSDTWSYDSGHHWRTCGCGAELEYAEHHWQKPSFWSLTSKCDCGAEKTFWSGSTLSEGNGVIVIVIAAAAVIAVGALVIVKKKKNTAE